MRPGSPRWRLHVALGIGLVVCAVGFAVELQRGLDGHLPAWVYVLEWPLFGAAGAFLWWRLMHDEQHSESQPTPRRLDEVDDHEVDDPGLDAWRDYVGRLQSGDPTDPTRRSGQDAGSA